MVCVGGTIMVFFKKNFNIAIINGLQNKNQPRLDFYTKQEIIVDRKERRR